MANWLERTCRKRCAVQSALFGGAAGLLLISALAAIATTSSTLTGPHQVEASTIAAARSVAEIPVSFVSVDAADAIDTGLVYQKTRGGKVESSKTYWAIRCGEKVLLVLAEERPKARVEGTLERMSSDLRGRFDGPQAAELVPMVLEEGDPRVLTFLGDLLLAGGAGLFGWLFSRSFRRVQDPSLHPAVARFGGRDARSAASARIEAELADSATVRFCGHDLTPHFLVDQRSYRFNVRSFDDLVWAYRKSTKHSVNFIPTGSTHAAVLCFADGAEVTLDGGRSETTVQQILGCVEVRAPWAIHGFDARTESFWAKDRAAIVTAVAERRASLTPPPMRG